MQIKINNIFQKIYGSPVKVFIILATIFGLFSALLVPPFDKPDESANFIRAYGISNGEFFVNGGTSWPGYDIHGVKYSQSKSGTVTIPDSYRESRVCLGIGGSYPWMETKKVEQSFEAPKPYDDITRAADCAASNPLDEDETEHLVGDAAYSPVSYIPHVIAISIGKLFDLPIITTFYLVRIFNFALWVALVALAIKIVPSRKWALALVALFPSFTFSMAHTTPDPTLFGAIAVFIAIILRSVYLTPKQLKKEGKLLLSILLVASVLMVLAKSSYGVLFLPLILFFGGLKKHLIIKFTAIALLALLSLNPLNSWKEGGGGSLIPEANTKQTLMQFPKAVIVQIVDGESVSPLMFSGALILPTVPQAWLTMLASMILILILFINYERGLSRPKLAIKNKERLLLIVAGVSISCLVFCGAVYLLWQQFGYVQPVPLVPGRYFLSILMLLAILPFMSKVVTSESNYKKIGILGIILLNVLLILIFIRGAYL